VPLLAHAVGAHGASYTIGVARGAVPRVRTPKFVGLSLGGYVVSSPPPPLRENEKSNFLGGGAWEWLTGVVSFTLMTMTKKKVINF